jgi:hypothetical protein
LAAHGDNPLDTRGVQDREVRFRAMTETEPSQLLLIRRQLVAIVDP